METNYFFQKQSPPPPPQPEYQMVCPLGWLQVCTTTLTSGVEMLGAQVPAGTQHFSWELNIAS